MIKDRSHEQINKEQLTSDAPTMNSHTQKRRKLLKGAASLPVIMTLYSGAALARTSNITGAADSIENAVFLDTVDGPQLLCVFPDPFQEQIPGGPYDLGTMPEATLIQDPKINVNANADTIMTKKLQQLEACQARGGIMISAAAYTSIMSKTGININPTL